MMSYFDLWFSIIINRIFNFFKNSFFQLTYSHSRHPKYITYLLQCHGPIFRCEKGAIFWLLIIYPVPAFFLLAVYIALIASFKACCVFIHIRPLYSNLSIIVSQKTEINNDNNQKNIYLRHISASLW